MEFKIDKNSISFDSLFPFYFMIDHHLMITECGSSIRKLVPDLTGSGFFNRIEVNKPWSADTTFIGLRNNIDQFFILHIINSGIMLRGMFVELKTSEKLLFCGSPWLSNFDELVEKGLTISDFSLSDPSVDFLQLIKLHEINNNDINNLVERLKKKNLGVEASEKYYRDIIEKSHDFILRTNQDGKITYANPACISFFGLSKDDLYKTNYIQCIDGNETGRLKFQISKALLLDHDYFQTPICLKNSQGIKQKVIQNTYLEKSKEGIQYLLISHAIE